MAGEQEESGGESECSTDRVERVTFVLVTVFIVMLVTVLIVMLVTVLTSGCMLVTIVVVLSV